MKKKVYIRESDNWILKTEHTFIYDGWNMICETQVSSLSTQVSSFVWGLDLSGTLQDAGGVGGLLCSGGSLSSMTYAYDVNGNVMNLVDTTDGATAATYDYDPFGRLLAATGDAADANPYRFSSKYLDIETQLYYYGYRFYHTSLGRWMSRDPIGERGEGGLYSFVRGNPVSLVDRLGLSINVPASDDPLDSYNMDLTHDVPNCTIEIIAGHYRITPHNYNVPLCSGVDVLGCFSGGGDINGIPVPPKNFPSFPGALGPGIHDRPVMNDMAGMIWSDIAWAYNNASVQCEDYDECCEEISIVVSCIGIT